MKFTIQSSKSKALNINKIKRIDTFGHLLRLMFQTEAESHSAFQQIREFGIRCCHAGENAPEGPMVLITDYHHINFNIHL